MVKEKIDRDRLLEAIKVSPKQIQLTVHSILCLKQKGMCIFTGEVYEIYKEETRKFGLRLLTQRRVSDIITELGILGIVQTKIINQGRYGRTREIHINHPPSTIREINKALEMALKLNKT